MVTRGPTQNLGPIGSAVLRLIGYKQTEKQTNKQTDKQSKKYRWHSVRRSERKVPDF